MKNTLFLLCAIVGFNVVMAQERVVSGKVTSFEDGSAVPGVNILLKGTSEGTITDADGSYRLKVPLDKSELLFSFVGMLSLEEVVGQRSVINVQMQLDSKQLSEVVVVAYGEESRRSLSGAVASIDNEIIENQQVSSVTRSLSGTIPGVTIIAATGQPGDNPVIRIRGIASIDSGNDPLIVLDGSVYSSNINTIPASDIASISVLKDASASALYGSRAANGVIIITTKQGKFTKGKPRTPNFNFKMTSGVSYRARENYEFLDASQAMQMEWEAIKNDAVDSDEENPGQLATDKLLERVGYNPFGGQDSPIDTNGDVISGKKLLWDTDWEEAIFTDVALRNEYSLNVSGGSERINYFLGGSLLDQSGMVEKSDFKRYTARMNLNVKLTEWLYTGFRQSISSSNQQFPNQESNSYSNGIQWINVVSNIYPVYKRDNEGVLKRDEGDNLIYDTGDDNSADLNGARPPLSPGNTAGLTQLNEALSKRFSSVTNFLLSANFLKDFTIKTNYQLNKYILDDFDYTNPLFGSAKSVNGRISRNKDITTEWTWTNSFLWSKEFGGSHNVEALVLQEMYDYSFERLDVNATGLPFSGLYEFNSTATPETISGYLNQERLSSLMGRLKYNYQGKYFFEASYRLDKSSRFSPENRNGNFYSVAGHWILTEEPFLQGSALNFMKIRMSYGQIGNNQILDNTTNPSTKLYFPYLETYNTGEDQPGVSGIYPSSGLANGALTWESVNTINVGVDFGLFEDRLMGSIDAYKSATKGLVTALATVPSRGIRDNKTISNIGNVTNSGIEISLTSDIIQKPDFNWRVSLNVAFEKNIITELHEKKGRVSGSKKLVEGRSIYDFWIRDYAGVDPNSGKPTWWEDSVQINEDDGSETVIIERFRAQENYDRADRYFVGTALPWAKGGFSSRMSFKGFDFSFLLNFALGGNILDYDYAGLMHGGRRTGNQYSINTLNRWQNPGDITNVPRLSGSDRGNSRSTRFIFDATYARLRNVTIGYSLPSSVLGKLGGFVKSFRIFASVDNAVTLFGQPGLDPEQTIQGTTDDRSAMMKTYSGGLELKF